ncbi:MAG: hypothetical protein KatS3mg076_2194 [Candidatus Binatia bacterium]|nr:MAG: hypothetical protein KatS3mg076_2194 [Candidatus Binatia bacterium]
MSVVISLYRRLPRGVYRRLARTVSVAVCFAALACGNGGRAGGTSTPSPTVSPGGSPSPSPTASATPTATPSPPSPSPTSTLSPTRTASPTRTPTRTATPTGTVGSGIVLEEVSVSLETRDEGAALLVTPATALRGGRTYAVLLTRRIHDAGGRALEADEFFATLLGRNRAPGSGPIAYFSQDAESPRNPYPDSRLVRPDGTVRVPDHVAFGGLDGPAFASARTFLRTFADDLESIPGFSTTAPVRIALSGPVELDSIDDGGLFFFERPDGSLDLEPLLDYAEQLGVGRDEVVLAFSFPTQPIEDDLRSVRGVLLSGEPVRTTFEDPDPTDDLPIGVFRQGDPGFPVELFGQREVGEAAIGLLFSPEFRGENGTFVPSRVRGEEPAPRVPTDVIVTIPSGGEPPYPVVVLQHGFAGSNRSMLPIAAALAREGFAAVAISAVSHGRRGNPFDLLTSRPIQARDIFRQTVADQMALVRAIEAGVDLEGDGVVDLDPERIGYLGQSLGAIVGSVFVAVEDRVRVGVLNVGGGRIAFLGQAPAVRPIYTGYYASQVGLDPASAEFEAFLARLLELGQQALDPADPLNYARRWRIDPFPGAPPRRVLLQEGIGDDWVPNEFTEALARAGGLPANEPASDAAGVSGLWRWEPPGGHGILSRPEVLEQAVRFLVSGGTEIVSP